MKKILLFSCALIMSYITHAQNQTYFIDWSFNSNPNATGDANSDRTIEVGDTVEWNWYANGAHSVVSELGATESFDSGLHGSGYTFSFTFTQVGTNPYICGPHPNNMYGTITVVPDGSLNTQEFLSTEDVSLFPNPVTDILNIDFTQNKLENTKLIFYNILGQKVKLVDNNIESLIKVDISDLNSGIYLLKIKNSSSELTKRFIKK